ncbi:Ferritin/ribonucleotide reductase-like protein [Ophiocordyceps camponoti-floridani]|uniref:Ferritin/ribonucleotide reductase-like protein n=1 Tax=Ophiocordyceps camponoti-floridani TaxID=2030778 RepID=A0A8H4Q424_9HYPO|nr:Ferritin/ribonucleotide reductase-like protein [Ophiocordyceps camponoti-floridani]
MVFFTTCLAAVVLAAAACARPTPVTLKARQEGGGAVAGDANMDVLVVKYARGLELLESEFYRQVITQNARTGFFNNKQIEQMTKILDTEDAHATALQQALSAAGGPLIRPCKYKFDLSDANTILTTATILEEGGQAAYQGAAPLLQDKKILATAASILTVEAQHSTVLRMLGDREPVARPFTNSLNPPDVSTLVEGFIESCEDDSNPLRLVPPNPQLQTQPTPGTPQANSQLSANPPTNRAATTGAVNGATFLRFSIASGGLAQSPSRQAAAVAAAPLPSASEAKFCAFVEGPSARFVDYAEPQGCQQPDDLVKPGYVMLTRERDVSTVLAGPMPIP